MLGISGVVAFLLFVIVMTVSRRTRWLRAAHTNESSDGRS
jgi:hypothetical protein